MTERDCRTREERDRMSIPALTLSLVALAEETALLYQQEQKREASHDTEKH